MLHTRIEYLRWLKGWTQDTLAARAEINRNTIVRAESGKLPRPTTLSRIAKALGISIDAIYTDDLHFADGFFDARHRAA